MQNKPVPKAVKCVIIGYTATHTEYVLQEQETSLTVATNNWLIGTLWLNQTATWWSLV